MASLTEQAFWDLVTTSDLGLDPQSVSDNLNVKLAVLTDQQLIEFDKYFGIAMHKCFTWDLFGAAFVMAGCNDDYGFSEFRCWLISRGKTVFDNALVNADSIVQCTPVYYLNEQPYPYIDEYDLIAGLLYEERNDDELPFIPSGSDEPKGKRFKDKPKLLKQSYPLLFSKYWQ
jgi:hypothetical protein